MKFSFMIVVILIILFSGCDKQEKKPVTASCLKENEPDMNDRSYDKLQAILARLQQQYEECGTVTCCEFYVEKVINEGSNVLHRWAKL